MLIQNWPCAVKKTIFGSLIGVFLAFGFHHGILADLGISDEILIHFSFAVFVVLGVSCAFSERVQCVGLICAVFFCSRNGRRNIQALLFTLLITGPGHNIIFNAKEAVRTFGCAVELTFNISRDYTYLTVEPFSKAILEIDHDESAKSIYRAVETMRKQIVPINTIVKSQLQVDSEEKRKVRQKYKIKSSDTDAEAMEKQIKETVEIGCLNSIEKSRRNCREIYDKTYNECMGGVSELVAWLICQPLKVDYLCDLSEFLTGRTPCDASEHLSPGYGAAFNILDASNHSLESILGEAKFRYKLPDPDMREQVQDMTSSTKTIIARVRAKAEGAELLLGLMNKVVALMFLPTILKAVKYLNNYLQRPGYDNIFITKKFEALNEKRESQGRRPVLLPLRKMERKNLVFRSSWLPNGPEATHYFKPCFRLLLLFFIVLVVWTTDYLYYRTLMVVADHGRFNVTVSGNHTVHIKVAGTGFVAQLVRSVTEKFNNDALINDTLSNEHCLPRPAKLKTYYNVKISICLLLMAGLVVLDHLTDRARNSIIAWYYPERECQRTVFLYNKLLKIRMQWMEVAKKAVRAKMGELTAERKRLRERPAILKAVTSISEKWWKRKRCVLCSAKEARGERFVYCKNCLIKLYFCVACWRDVDCKCLVCSIKTAV
ncbi:Hypothetical predicted protein [Cloeon dipterum]|uniref:Dendritic cell-specific transmembrane protein-like domain-containing protein n=3 Tax=Cloeon dipterum TaxID=197152 RepID=A0A8S1CEI9_9INSE|nr:Hypothetical predicted protein [Cloeon dipterum]